jgi:hypothetical protein
MPQYSGVIPGAPVALTERDKQWLPSYLNSEIEEALQAHEVKLSWIDESNRLYMGDPANVRKTFPWDGAANLVIPLVGITVDSIVARIMNTIFAVQPFWSAEALIKDLEPVVNPLQDFMEWSRVNETGMYTQTRSWVVEVVKHGWAYLKVYWESYTQRSFVVSNGAARPKDIIVRRPRVQHVLLADIICQAGIEDELNQAEWLAHRVRLTDGQLRWRQHDKVYDNVDKILETKDQPTPMEEKVLENEFEVQASRSKDKLNTLYEIYGDLPLGGSRLPVPVMITYHHPTKTIARCVYNPDITGERPFKKGKFIDREGKRDGVGISRQLSLLQEEISTLHNQQVDNATLANTRFFIGRRGVVRNGTRVWPGRFLTVPDPSRDIITLPMADIYPSMRTLETSCLAYAERRSGVADYQLGRESNVMGNRATATGTLALIQEGNRRFDLNVRDVRDCLGAVGKKLLLLNCQFRPKGMAYFVKGSDGKLVEQVLDLPEEFIADGIGMELTASTATINREIEKQGLLSMMGTLTQYYQQILQMSSIAMSQDTPPPVKQMVAEMADGARYLMKMIVQTFEIRAVDTLLPPSLSEQLESANAAAQQQGGPGGGPQQGPNGPGVGAPVGAPPGGPAGGPPTNGGGGFVGSGP